MQHVFLPLLYALFVWWFSTGLILSLNRLPRRARGWIMLGASVALLLALAVLWRIGPQQGVSAAYLGFTAALLAGAWVEVAFLTGVVTGPNRQPCPPGARGWERFLRAFQTLLWHELAIVGCFLLVLAVAAGPSGQAALASFALLWAMRISAKINIYLGMPNAPHAFLPEHLRYMGSYFRARPMNAFFPVAITAATALCVWLAICAAQAESQTQAAIFTLLATRAALAVMEHWFLVLSIPSENLWRWALPGAPAGRQIAAGPLASPVGVALPNRTDAGP